MLLQPSGSVGIGTSTPTARLNVSGGDVVVDRGTATSTLTRNLTLGGARDANGSDFAQLDFRNYDLSNGQAECVGARIASRNDGSSDDGDLRFSVASDSTLTERMLIKSDGNVGIGTDFPLTKLDVRGAVATDHVFAFSNTQQGGSPFAAYIAQPAASSLGFFTDLLERMRIDSFGHVGIGAGNPGGFLLAVNGDAAKPGGGSSRFAEGE